MRTSVARESVAKPARVEVESELKCSTFSSKPEMAVRLESQPAVVELTRESANELVASTPLRAAATYSWNTGERSRSVELDASQST